MHTQTHEPVMLEVAVAGLDIQKNGRYVDATFGRGGHAEKILESLGSGGTVFAFDRDVDAIIHGRKMRHPENLHLIHSPFSKMCEVLEPFGAVGKIDGILMDLGVSSPQLANPARGFSFNLDGPLDMRMDQRQKLNAAGWLHDAEEREIADVLWKFGEERRARKIARAIKQHLSKNPTTKELAAIISAIVPAGGGKHPATRSFQAIRMFINRELEELNNGLLAAKNLLTSGGRLAVIAFHSLEDRLVKRFIDQNEIVKTPRKLPLRDEKTEPPIWKKIARHFPSADEIRKNPKARSAVLRIAEKC